MDRTEILKHIANSHNLICRITVSGDNAIIIGDAIKELRYLAQELKKDIEDDNADGVEE